ncbi:uncharacterized protein V6R79_015313 [Siganus canaliculatus]
MKTWALLGLLVVYLHGTSAMKHSLKYFVTAASGVQNHPEFEVVVEVDDVQAGYCDSKTAEPKQEWARKLAKDDPQHQEWYSLKCAGSHKFFRANLDILKQRLNQTGGVHVLQMMEGCEWDDETGEVTAFNQYGYDGEDFISLDMETITWIAPKPQAVITKLRWDSDRSRLEYNKNFYAHTCPGRLRRYVDYGRSLLQRKEIPSVSLLQKTPSSPVRCFATGFYPDRAMLFWRRDGVEIHEDVEPGEILPNQDGTFQMSVDLDVSSVRAEDWDRLDCVFQFSGGTEDMVTRLDRAGIKTNAEKPVSINIIGAAVAVVAFITVIVIFISKKKKGTTADRHWNFSCNNRNPVFSVQETLLRLLSVKVKKVNTDTTQS